MKFFNTVPFLFLIFAHLCFADDFNVLNGIELPDISDSDTGLDPEVLANLTKDSYVIPNERNPHFYNDIFVESTGTLISVGTFRSLIALSESKFDRLIMLDVAMPILNFNRQHLSFIKNLANSFPDSIQTQRDKYKKEYEKYLNEFAANASSYYWQDDNKWQKIIDKLNEKKIHVIRGNLAYPSANRALIKFLQTLDGKIMIDLSNVAQYVEQKENLATGLDAFAAVTRANNVAILATYQADNRGNPYSRFFEVGEDPPLSKEQKKEHQVDWTYYYFPYLTHYNESITNKKLTIIEVNEEEMVPTLSGFLFSAFKVIKKRLYSNETIIKNFWDSVSLSVNNEFREKIYKRTFEDFLVPELRLRGLSQDVQKTYEETLIDALAKIATDNLNYVKKNGQQNPAPLGFFFQ